MSSQTTKSTDRWGAVGSLTGTLIWAVLAAFAGARHAKLGIIELLLLFAVLVVVPLGLALMESLGSSVFRAARLLQSFAAICAVGAMLLPPGTMAAAFVLPWLSVALLIAFSGTMVLLQNKSWSLISLVIAVSGADLAIASTWLLISRLGLRPLGFQEPIILLTAVHFHYSGFATALIGSCMLRWSDLHGFRAHGLRNAILLVVFLPFAVAAGFTFSAPVRTVTAIALAASIAALAAIQWRLASSLHVRGARIFLRLASGAVFAGMGLACLYVIGEQTGKNWLTIPAMASTHGVLNGLGFVLLSLLGWLLELHSQEYESLKSVEEEHEDRNHGRQWIRRSPSGAGAPAARSRSHSHRAGNGSARPECPEFLAREFYDK
jgi:hypothetical protein